MASFVSDRPTPVIGKIEGNLAEIGQEQHAPTARCLHVCLSWIS